MCSTPTPNRDKPEKITLETKCWQGDWERILKGDYLAHLARLNSHKFDERVLIINNVEDLSSVFKHADLAVAKGYITSYVNAEKWAAETLEYFKISKEELGRGYVYSIAELVGIYVCQTEYLLHYAGDCEPVKPCQWINEALDQFKKQTDVKVANLTWDANYAEAKRESTMENEQFFMGQGFSDQCYLIRVADFKQPIYHCQHPASARYPKYGGELFEKRVDAWMRTCGHLRATYKHGAYLHRRKLKKPKIRDIKNLVLNRLAKLSPVH